MLVPTFADRGCHVVSVTDTYGHILRFLDIQYCTLPDYAIVHNPEYPASVSAQ
jgi:hypothetical protein